MTVTAVIPTWNRADLLDSILNNLGGQTRPPDRICVVDNGSNDGSADLARAHGADVIKFSTNRGFAVAVNEGIAAAPPGWVFIVNNDVVLSRNWLEVALRSTSEMNAPFICGKLLRPQEGRESSSTLRKLDGSFDLPSRAMYAWRCGYGKPDGSVWSERRRIFWAPMTAALYQKNVFDRVGLLDTRFESYYEDVEFGLRCALAGIEGLYEPALHATHGSKTTLGKSSRRVYFYTARNQLFILAKHYPAFTLRRFAWPILIGQFLSLVAAAKQRNLVAGLRGKWAALRAWSSLRGEFTPDRSPRLDAILLRSEREIQELQKITGYNIYWRTYFALVKPERPFG